MFWMMHRGLHQYTDFYSYHLPTYFWMLSPLVGDDLSFVYWLRATTLIAVIAYATMTRPLLWPFVLIFVIFARMAEIRPDTFGLLLMNAGWFALLKRRTVLGGVLAGLSLLFSARASVVSVGFALACIQSSEWSQVRRLMLIGVAAAIALGMALVIFPHEILLILRASFLEPGRAIPKMGLGMRLGFDRFGVDRLVPLAMILISLLASGITWARDRADRDAAIIAIACATQLVLILVDPAPYEYVYGWAMIPAVNGLLLASRLVSTRPQALLSAIAGAGALLIPAGTGFDYVVHGNPPRARSQFHVFPDTRRIPVTTLSITDLVAASDDPGEIWNQLAARRELCRRISGPVSAVFTVHPICLRDATYEWSGVTWSPRTYEQISNRGRAQLLIWGDSIPAPRHLAPGYIMGDGFALKGVSPTSSHTLPSRRR